MKSIRLGSGDFERDTLWGPPSLFELQFRFLCTAIDVEPEVWNMLTEGPLQALEQVYPREEFQPKQEQQLAPEPPTRTEETSKHPLGFLDERVSAARARFEQQYPALAVHRTEEFFSDTLTPDQLRTVSRLAELAMRFDSKLRAEPELLKPLRSIVRVGRAFPAKR